MPGDLEQITEHAWDAGRWFIFSFIMVIFAFAVYRHYITESNEEVNQTCTCVEELDA